MKNITNFKSFSTLFTGNLWKLSFERRQLLNHLSKFNQAIFLRRFHPFAVMKILRFWLMSRALSILNLLQGNYLKKSQGKYKISSVLLFLKISINFKVITKILQGETLSQICRQTNLLRKSLKFFFLEAINFFQSIW